MRFDLQSLTSFRMPFESKTLVPFGTFAIGMRVIYIGMKYKNFYMGPFSDSLYANRIGNLLFPATCINAIFRMIQPYCSKTIGAFMPPLLDRVSIPLFKNLGNLFVAGTAVSLIASTFINKTEDAIRERAYKTLESINRITSSIWSAPSIMVSPYPTGTLNTSDTNALAYRINLMYTILEHLLSALKELPASSTSHTTILFRSLPSPTSRIFQTDEKLSDIIDLLHGYIQIATYVRLVMCHIKALPDFSTLYSQFSEILCKSELTIEEKRFFLPDGTAN